MDENGRSAAGMILACPKCVSAVNQIMSCRSFHKARDSLSWASLPGIPLPGSPSSGASSMGTPLESPLGRVRRHCPCNETHTLDAFSAPQPVKNIHLSVSRKRGRSSSRKIDKDERPVRRASAATGGRLLRPGCLFRRQGAGANPPEELASNRCRSPRRGHPTTRATSRSALRLYPR